MLECIKFIFKIVTDFIKMLFTIDIGSGMSLGLFMCIIFIVLPMLLSLFTFFKNADDLEFAEMFKSNKAKYKGKHEYEPKHAKK